MKELSFGTNQLAKPPGLNFGTFSTSRLFTVLWYLQKIPRGPPTHVKFNPRVQFFILFHLPTLWSMTHNKSSEKKIKFDVNFRF